MANRSKGESVWLKRGTFELVEDWARETGLSRSEIIDHLCTVGHAVVTGSKAATDLGLSTRHYLQQAAALVAHRKVKTKEPQVFIRG